MDITVYKELVRLDTKLGVTASEQLYKCLFHTSRLDIVEVWFCYLNKGFKKHLSVSILSESMNINA